MAIKLIKKDNLGFGTYQEFMIDSEDDLEVIEDIYDCELGDKAYTVDGRIFTRHSDSFDGDLWKATSAQEGSDSEQEDNVAGGVFIVTVTASYGETAELENVTADKTVAEIIAAYEAGLMPYCNLVIGGYPTLMPPLLIANEGGAASVVFSVIVPDIYSTGITEIVAAKVLFMSDGTTDSVTGFMVSDTWPPSGGNGGSDNGVPS